MARTDDAHRAIAREMRAFGVEHQRRIPKFGERRRPGFIVLTQQPEAQVADAPHLSGPAEFPCGDRRGDRSADPLDLGQLIRRGTECDREIAAECVA